VLHAAEHGTEAGDHSVNRQTMSDAIDLTCWFCAQSLDVVPEKSREKEGERLSRLVKILVASAGKQETVRNLGKNNGFRKEELERLVGENPSLLEMVEVRAGPQGGGRPRLFEC